MLKFSSSNQRLYALLFILGACTLLSRTVIMLVQGSLGVLVLWVSILLFAEMLLDAGWLYSAIGWFIANDENESHVPLRLAAAGIILHAIRVYIFVLGRIGPWIDFDVRPEQRAMHHTRWTWGGVYFAFIMATLGVVGVIIIWMIRRRARKRTNK
jgi:hypothetical protein